MGAAIKRYDQPAKAVADDPGTIGPEEFFSYRLTVLARLVDRQGKRYYSRNFGLSLVEWRVIALIAQVGEETANYLAKRTDYDKSQISRAVAALIQRGILFRRDNAEDQRSHLLTLSEDGKALHQREMPLGRERQRQILRPLTQDQRVKLIEAMDILTGHMREMDRQANQLPPAANSQSAL